jgi:hypothetical protein
MIRKGNPKERFEKQRENGVVSVFVVYQRERTQGAEGNIDLLLVVVIFFFFFFFLFSSPRF